MSGNNQGFGDFLKYTRVRYGYKTQKKLAEISGVSQTTLSRIEAGIQKPLPETLKLLAPHLRPYTYGELMDKAGYFEGTSSGLTREVAAVIDNNEELNKELDRYIDSMTIGGMLKPEAIHSLELELSPILHAENIEFAYAESELRHLLVELDSIDLKNSVLQAFIRADKILKNGFIEPQTIAAHHESEEWTEEELEEIERFKEFVRSKRKGK
ncbi:transcriptional regulator with XRE-family HTH domain [Paenibacillus eucommiae]|uniref:Transcriptional regulator with XRE-family HTH domain n=1 Tax=Paenibacillus eucommiae TaxID=1355755 RepID=A0ABS4IRN8_9BACL|nr:transcriptional regulator with XRE-family HTH domain [Paenibacillus eucommiae]